MSGTGLALTGFAEHTGPVSGLDGGDGQRFRLRLENHHLNFADRFHGGMVMTLLCIAMAQVATKLAARALAGSTASLLSLNCDFIGTTGGGTVVMAEVSVTRATRSVLFLTCRLFAGEEVLTSASAIYKIMTPALLDPARIAEPSGLLAPSAAAGWTPVPTTEPFGLHVGPVFERAAEAGDRAVRFAVDERRLDQHGLGQLHDGMLLYVADLFTGRAARRAAQRICVTLTMQARRLGVAQRGEWVEFRPHPPVITPSVVFVEGSFHGAAGPLMTVSSAWKMLGAP
jgi:acyl-coenzyme A thioesterase PaaI-like protein